MILLKVMYNVHRPDHQYLSTHFLCGWHGIRLVCDCGCRDRHMERGRDWMLVQDMTKEELSKAVLEILRHDLDGHTINIIFGDSRVREKVKEIARQAIFEATSSHQPLKDEKR